MTMLPSSPKPPLDDQTRKPAGDRTDDQPNDNGINAHECNPCFKRCDPRLGHRASRSTLRTVSGWSSPGASNNSLNEMARQSVPDPKFALFCSNLRANFGSKGTLAK
jgi:hypothetical protein